MLNRALEKAKRDGGKKIPINFQVHTELKSDFENLCKEHSVSITSMLTGLMETAIEESKGIYYEINADSLLSTYHRIIELKTKIDDYYDIDKSTGDRVFNESLYDIPIAMHEYNEAKYELSILEKIIDSIGENKW